METTRRNEESGVVWGSMLAGRSITTAPGITLRQLSGEKLMLCAVELEPNAVLPTHSHPHEQGGIILDGDLELTVGDEIRRLGPGDGFVIPGGVEHSAVAGPNGARTIDVFTPPRDEFLT